MTCTQLQTQVIAPPRYLHTHDKSNVTQVPASMTNLFIQETARLLQQEPSYQFQGHNLLTKGSPLEINELLLPFSNSKDSFFDSLTDATTKYLVCKYF
jgi:hypothetical protein